MSAHLTSRLLSWTHRGYTLGGVIAIVLFSVHSPARELSPDIRFIYLAKWVNYEQHAANDIRTRFYGYGAQIFAVADGRVKNAVLSGPMPARQLTLLDDGDKYPGQNLRFDSGQLGSREEMNKAFPDGEYRFQLSTLSGDFEDHTLVLDGAKGDLASASTLTLSQCGRDSVPTSVIPDQDLTVSWSDFAIAAVDPRKVMDDLIVVKLTDDEGRALKRSPLPYFSSAPVIPYDASAHVLPGEWLEAGTIYGIEIEKINVVDSYIREGIPEVAAFVSNTRIMISTLAAPKSCGDEP